MEAPRDHWPRHAQQWALVGPPLRPGPADRAIAQAVLGPVRRAVVLGVTPELIELAWPADSAVVAVERSRAVIDAIFPRGRPHARAVQADWRALPVATGAIDRVLGDGSLSNLAFPDDYRALAAELARVLRADGAVALRLFAAPPHPESIDAIAAALRAGQIGSMHALKWRLAMAIQPADFNVAVADIGRAFDAIAPNRAAIATRTGWPRPVIDAIDVYQGSALRYSFPPLDAVRAVLAPWLRETACHTPGYELGARCPTVIFARA
jgi:SAM-dependent methyltransferase